MAEKQPTAYVVCRYTVETHDEPAGDNVPVKVFDTRRESRDYIKRMNKRSKKYQYIGFPVKQG